MMQPSSTRRVASWNASGSLHSVQGKQLDKVDDAHAGDIIACVKLRETQTGDTLCDKNAPIVYDGVEYP